MKGSFKSCRQLFAQATGLFREESNAGSKSLYANGNKDKFWESGMRSWELIQNDLAEGAEATYRNLCAARTDRMQEAKRECEVLWALYRQHADSDFRTEARTSFSARYWEMYLTVTLMNHGHQVTCPKPGPDVGIVVEGQRIWFEATSPSRGSDGSADQVPEFNAASLGEKIVVQDVPNEKLVLRYLNSVAEKRKQHDRWLKNGTISPDDAFIIALNPKELGFEHADGEPPRILQAAFALGSPYLVINRENLEQVGSGYRFRERIPKANGKPVSTAIFEQPEYACVSGLLCSRIDVCNQPERMGGDFQLVPNPHARVPLPKNFCLRGTYFRIDRVNGGYNAVAEPH